MSLILWGIRAGKVESVLALLRDLRFPQPEGEEVDLDTQDAAGATALAVAAEHGQADIVNALLDAGAGVDATDITGATALAVAAERGHLDVARQLLDRGAATEIADASDVTPLGRAARAGHLAVVRLLLERGADATRPQAKEWTAVSWAVGQGPAPFLKTEEHGGVVAELVERGANPNEKLPLHFSAAAGRSTIVDALLSGGASVAAVDEHGDTALHVAAAADRPEAVAVLLAHGALLTTLGRDGLSPVARAIHDGTLRTLAALLSEAQPHDLGAAHTADNETPFTYAARTNNVRALRLLCKRAPQFPRLRPCRAAIDHDALDAFWFLWYQAPVARRHALLARDREPGFAMKFTPVVVDALLKKIDAGIENWSWRAEVVMWRTAARGRREWAASGPPQPGPAAAELKQLLECPVAAARERVASVLRDRLRGELIERNGALVLELHRLGIRPRDPLRWDETALLRVALEHDRLGVIATLVLWGGPEHKLDGLLQQQLRWMCNDRKADHVAALVRAGVDAHRADPQGASLLTEAVRREREHVVDALLSGDQDLTALLRLYAGRNHHRVVEALLQRGADPFAVDDGGRSALFFAVQADDWDTAVLLFRRVRSDQALLDGQHALLVAAGCRRAYWLTGELQDGLAKPRARKRRRRKQG